MDSPCGYNEREDVDYRTVPIIASKGDKNIVSSVRQWLLFQELQYSGSKSDSEREDGSPDKDKLTLTQKRLFEECYSPCLVCGDKASGMFDKVSVDPSHPSIHPSPSQINSVIKQFFKNQIEKTSRRSPSDISGF